MFTLEFTRRFAMAHRLLADGSEKCAIPHGHNEQVTVRLAAVRPARLDGAGNMVESFARAKRLWHRWIDDQVDHAFQVADTDPLIGWFRAHEPQRLNRLLVTPGDPTTEVLACCFMAKINAFLVADGDRLHCVEVRIEETPTNTVSFTGRAEDWLPHRPGLARPWWLRPDPAINDLVAGDRQAGWAEDRSQAG